MYSWIELYISFLFCQVTHGADINYLRSVITDHFSDNRNHEVNNAYKSAAKAFIYQEFKKNGLETEYHTFDRRDISSEVSFANIVGIMEGANFGSVNDKIYGLGAHYDTVRDTKGVDDNGSGVAAMLEVVRQLGSQNGVKRNNTIMFAAFDLKENDYVGSKDFIQNWFYPWLDKHYGRLSRRSLVAHGIIVLDTIMEYNTSTHSQHIPKSAEKTAYFPKSLESITSDNFRGDFLAVVYRCVHDLVLANSLRTSWAAEERTQFELESFALPFADIKSLNNTFKNSFGNFFKSDHINFWGTNIPAIFLTDSANLRGDMVQCYHNPCDDLDTMLTDDNINFIGKTADSIARSLHELSQPLHQLKQSTKSLRCGYPISEVTQNYSTISVTSGCRKWTYNIILCLALLYVGSMIREYSV